MLKINETARLPNQPAVLRNLQAVLSSVVGRAVSAWVQIGPYSRPLRLQSAVHSHRNVVFSGWYRVAITERSLLEFD